MNTHNLPHHHPQREEMMMMKGLMVDHENMSNLTSASAEISASSSIRNESAGGSNLNYNQYSSASTNQLPPPPKRKRNLPGNPDPDAEVIALSPTTLLATNRFICEICNKGFQRDQNLQLHKRGHNLPWKLKQRTNKEVIRKKVYVCPVSTCVHHDPSRALGDLTGIKKHFCRKHGEKKWKCEKCSKIYAVKSDWKAHSKICGTREYRCDCGTIFSRRDSFITHRAFCDALAQETSGRGITPIINHHPLLISSQPRLHSHGLQASSSSSVKREQEFVPWLAPNLSSPPPPLLFSSSTSSLERSFIHHQNPNPSSSTRLVPPIATPTASPHTSATALLQRATKMGAATVSKASTFLPPHQPATSISGIMDEGWFGNIKATANPNSPSLLHDMISSLSSEAGLAAAASSYSYGDASNTTGSFVEIPSNNTTSETQLQASIGVGGVDGGNNEGLTRDFLGLRAFPQRDFFDIVGLHHINNSSSAYGEPQNHNQSQWPG